MTVEPTPPASAEPVRIGLLGGIRSGPRRAYTSLREARRSIPNERPMPQWVGGLAWVLDDSIPLPGGRRVGIDGFMTMVPGIGNVVGLTASMVVVGAGIAAGVSLPTVALMLVNLGIEGTIGTVPFLGGLFDLVYKGNNRNMRLIERDMADRAGTRRSAIRTLVVMVAAVFAWMALVLFAFLGGLYLFVRLFSGLL